MTDSIQIAHQELDNFQDGHISEDVAGWCFKITNGVAKAVTEIPMSNSDKVKALRLSAIMLLGLSAGEDND